MYKKHCCPACGAIKLTILRANYQGTDPFLATDTLRKGDRLICTDCGWIGVQSALKIELIPLGQRTYFEWNLKNNTSTHDEHFYQVMELEPGTEAPFLEFMQLVFPDDREIVVELLKRQFEAGGFQVSHFRLAKPPHKWLYSETTVELDACNQPSRMTGWIQESLEIRDDQAPRIVET